MDREQLQRSRAVEDAKGGYQHPTLTRIHFGYTHVTLNVWIL